MISDSPSLPNGNVTTATSSIGTAAVAAITGNGSLSTFFFAIFALYITLSVLYLLQNPISRLVGCCFGRKRKTAMGGVAVQHPNPPYNQYSYLRRISFCCSQMMFTIRVFLSNCSETIPTERHGRLDESKYDSWTVSQVACWAHSKLQNKFQTQINESSAISPFDSFSNIRSHTVPEGDLFNGREDEYKQHRSIQTAIYELKRQLIDGKSLRHLTLDHVLNFGIAFGVAVHLIACLDELIPNRFSSDEEKATGDLPSWYEEQSNEVAAKMNYETSSSTGGHELEMAEQAQNIMKDRFGMSLPTLRDQVSSDGGEGAQANLYTHKQQCPSEKLPQSHLLSNHQHHHGEDEGHHDTKSAAQDQGLHSHSLPVGQRDIEEILNSMPPQIRAVAERNPDLVTKLLLDKKQQTQSPLFQQQHHQQNEASPLQTVSEEITAYHSEEEFNIDPESQSLLRRRTNNR